MINYCYREVLDKLYFFPGNVLVLAHLHLLAPKGETIPGHPTRNREVSQALCGPNPQQALKALEDKYLQGFNLREQFMNSRAQCLREYPLFVGTKND